MSKLPIDPMALARATLGFMPPGPSIDELAVQLHNILYGNRGVWDVWMSGLNTAQEAAEVVAAKLETCLADQANGSLPYGASPCAACLAARKDALERA